MSDALILEIAGGVRIALPADPRLLSTSVFLEQEDWFEDEAAFVRAAVESGGRMLDIGASYGSYALGYASAAGADSQVWAFEPTPAVCEFVRESVRAGGLRNFTLLQTAVGAAPGRMRLSSHRDSELNTLDPARGNIEVQVCALDRLAAEHGFTGVDFAKLDVEGHEAAVVEGGEEFFRRESPLVMLEIKAGQVLDFVACARLEALGYELYRLIPHLGALAPLERESVDSYLLNVFACKPDRAAILASRNLLCRVAVTPPPVAEVAAVRARLAGIPGLAPVAERIDALLAQLPADEPAILLLRLDSAARDATLPLDARYAALRQAAMLARQSVAGGALSFLRASTVARVLRGWGDRATAVAIVQQLANAAMAGIECPLDAPFLPPLPAFDTWPGPDSGAWVSASVIEACALWSTFGIYWGEPFTGPAAEVLARYGRATPRLERRRQLRFIAEGRQAGPMPHPLLAEKTPENRNPQVWNRPLR